MNVLTSLIAGAIFGLGLVLSDMIDPERVQAFINLTSGAWDPTLAFVMGGAMVPMLIAWRIAASREAPAYAESFPAAASTAIDRNLILGAVIFGLGWGLVGLCPGPAISGLMIGDLNAVIFVAAMFVGFLSIQR